MCDEWWTPIQTNYIVHFGGYKPVAMISLRDNMKLSQIIINDWLSSIFVSDYNSTLDTDVLKFYSTTVKPVLLNKL